MRILLFASLLFFISCKAQQPKNVADNEPALSLEGRWELIEVNGQNSSDLSYTITPNLEFNLLEKRVNGVDGCNNFFGQLNVFDEEKIEIGLLGSTKAYCPEIKNEDRLGQYLNAIRTYKIIRVELYLYNDAGNEILLYRKIE